MTGRARVCAVASFCAMASFCAVASLLAGVMLSPTRADTQEYLVEVWKSKHRMEVWHDGKLLSTYEVAFGKEPLGDKEVQGDKRTPVGRYFVAEKHVSGRFHRFLGLSYPNIDDAARGYEEGLISASQWADIFVAEVRERMPTSSTRLGGFIGIHGYGRRPYVPVIDWTDGCLAVSNEEAEYLYRTLPIGTPVVIYD